MQLPFKHRRRMSFNRPTSQNDRSAAETPRLWAEGQQPPFNFLAYARVSLLLSRRAARPVFLGTADLFRVGAERVAENTLGPRFARVGRLGRALPSRDRVAKGLQAGAAFMTASADWAAAPPSVEPPPDNGPDQPDSPPMLLISRHSRQITFQSSEPVAAPAEPPKPAQVAEEQDFDAPTLAAIRAMIDEMRDPTPVAAPVVPKRPTLVALPPPSGRALLTHGVPLTPPEPQPASLSERVAARSYLAAAGLLGGGISLLILPIGLVRAALIHMNGEDLRTWS